MVKIPINIVNIFYSLNDIIFAKYIKHYLTLGKIFGLVDSEIVIG